MRGNVRKTLGDNKLISSVLRAEDRKLPEKIYAAERPQKFLREHLCTFTNAKDPVTQELYVGTAQNLLFFGPKGSGKSTVFHSMLDEILPKFTTIFQWKMEPANNQHFGKFIDECVSEINNLDHDIILSDSSARILILIGNIHYLQNIRESYGMNAITNLLSTVRRAVHCRDAIRVLMFSDGLPNMFGEEFSSLVDAKCLMPMFTIEERRSFFLDHMRAFHNALREKRLEGEVIFSISHSKSLSDSFYLLFGRL